MSDESDPLDWVASDKHRALLREAVSALARPGEVPAVKIAELVVAIYLLGQRSRRSSGR